MTMQEAVAYRSTRVPISRRLLAKIAIGFARALATQPPKRIRRILGWVRRGAAPASLETAELAHQTVTAVSLVCAGREGCLPRSLATALLCRLHGEWPAWCVGVRRLPPFYAHAWVEVHGRVVGDEYPADYFRPLITVR
jgi:hypothetical protein